MRPEELTAFGDLAGDAAAATAAQIRELHEGIASRVWRAVGPAALPVKGADDWFTGAAYSAAKELTRSLVRAGALAASVARPADAVPIDGTPIGRAVLGALNGIYGDRIDRSGSRLALTMSVRRGGRDVVPSTEALRDAFPDATSRLAVFVHGLCETDDAWKLRADRHLPYGVRLRSELGYTPLYLRYNTGRHVSENGRELAQLLERIVAGWPSEIDEIVLIGHSMGGLVGRSACHYGAGSEWTAKVRHVFTLGTPHLGAPLERFAHAASTALSRVPETRPLASALDARSAGIKDLLHGDLVDECWLDQDSDAFLRTTSRDIPFLQTANHYFVCATLSREPDSLSARMIGDLLVLRPSAWSHANRTERLLFGVEHYQHVGGANHFDLLNHPAIYEQIRRWLSTRRRPAVPAGGRHAPSGEAQRP